MGLAPTGSRSAGALFRGAAILAMALGAAAFLLLAAGPLGWRAGWWSYRLAFTALMPDAFCAGGAAALLALVALAGFRRLGRHGLRRALVGLALGLVALYFPWHAASQRGYPRIHDITTDAGDPPSLEFSAAMRVEEHGAPPGYPGAETAAIQRRAYPGIAPAELALPPDAAFARSLAIARDKGWTIVKSDPGAGIVDAYDRSFWFGFTDDVAIRIRPDGTGSRVDIRSASRQGHGDLGVNAARVRGFLAALTARP